MSARLTYFWLEWKRAIKRLPHIAAGALVLMLLMSMIAFAASKLLYGDAAFKRIAVGVILPKDDLVARKAVAMLGSLDSVESVCDFKYMNEKQALSQLKSGKIYGVMSVPAKFVQGILDGSNMPVTIILPQSSALEGKLLKELTQAGARTLGSAQAGIYAGDELLEEYGLPAKTKRLELDLNKLFLKYSLPREDYFRTVQVSATGDVDTLTFYGISAFVLYLLLAAIPISGYLKPEGRVLSQKLRLMGLGSFTTLAAKLLGVMFLLFAATLPALAVALTLGLLPFHWQLIPALLLLCGSAASLILFFYEAAGTLMGGVLLLFLGGTALLFLSGGFLPLAFLPAPAREAARFLPTTFLLNGAKMMVTESYKNAAWAELLFMTAACYGLSVGVKRR